MKERLLNEKTLKIVPIAGIILILVIVIISVVITRVQISGAQEDLAKVKAEIEEKQAEQAEEEKKEQETVSALTKGKKVASLESKYSKNLVDILRASNDSKVTYEKDNEEIVESLKEYFDDDSYKTAWYEGHLKISSPYWDFGTKYNMNTEVSEIPVIWVCYDGNVGGTVLAYTTATFHTETQKFSDAVTVVFNVDEEYGDISNQRLGTVLGLLQSDNPAVVESVESPEDVISESSETSETEESATDEQSLEETDTRQSDEVASVSEPVNIDGITIVEVN